MRVLAGVPSKGEARNHRNVGGSGARLNRSARVRATALKSPGVCGSHGATEKDERGLRLLPLSIRDASSGTGSKGQNAACETLPFWLKGAVLFARPHAHSRSYPQTRRLGGYTPTATSGCLWGTGEEDGIRTFYFTDFSV